MAGEVVVGPAESIGSASRARHARWGSFPGASSRWLATATVKRWAATHARLFWDHFGTTRCARWWTTCASMHVLPRQQLPPDTADQGKRVTAIFWGSSGRRFKSCQPDRGKQRL